MHRIRSKSRGWKARYGREAPPHRSGTPRENEAAPEVHRARSPLRHELSPWSRSRAKRILDVAAVLALSPILLPLLALIALAVLASSGVPVVFRQRRLGMNGEPFAIYKFRTMRHSPTKNQSAISADSADRVTPLGYFLRRTKLDELPQVLNVLAGDMGLVGPRPKVPDQQLEPLPCRPGLTSPATLAFAREEALLIQIPPDSLADFYHKTILPAKHRLDSEYLRQATISSDLRILLDTVLGRWGSCTTDIHFKTPEEECHSPSSKAATCWQ